MLSGLVVFSRRQRDTSEGRSFVSLHLNTFGSQHWQTNALEFACWQFEDGRATETENDEKQMWLAEKERRRISLVNIDTSVIVDSLD